MVFNVRKVYVSIYCINDMILLGETMIKGTDIVEIKTMSSAYDKAIDDKGYTVENEF